MSGLDKLATEIHEWAIRQGFYDREWLDGGARYALNVSLPSEKLMLIVTEVAEVQEALRDGNLTGKHGEAEELADVLIRVLDYAAWRGVSLDAEIARKMERNRERERLHGRSEF